MRTLLCVAAGLSLYALGIAAWAADAAYPVKPIRFIVPFPAGGNADAIARPLADKLAERWGQQVVIDNRGGAGGVIGESLAAQALPDGYTILYVSIAHAVNRSLHKKLPYDPVKDFEPVVLAVSVPNMLVVHQAVPARSVVELIELAKARPGQLNYGSSGNGTSQHLAGELFKRRAGVDIVRVAYKGSAAAGIDLVAGRIEMMLDVITNCVRYVATGRVRALGITSAERSSLFPNVPAIGEFVPGYELTGWQGILVPARTPPAIIKKLNDALVDILRSKDIRDKFTSIGANPVANTPHEFKTFIAKERVKWELILKQAGIEAE
ncbi:MAG: tripartite tricarboxylate transporter substrate binding protein [Burkholderiales bacterium]|nr:tripartite tricarboxylate transporter substrate binding protein [Burkholderiales bacterium]